jgi:hypothetical protein
MAPCHTFEPLLAGLFTAETAIAEPKVERQWIRDNPSNNYDQIAINQFKKGT